MGWHCAKRPCSEFVQVPFAGSSPFWGDRTAEARQGLPWPARLPCLRPRQQVLDTAVTRFCPAVMTAGTDPASVASVKIDGLVLAASKLDDRLFRAFVRSLIWVSYWPFASVLRVCSCCLIFVI